MVDDLIGAIETIRTRMQDCSAHPPILYLNDAEYAYFKMHEWIDFGVGSESRGRRFTNAQCCADTSIPAHVEVKVTPPLYPETTRYERCSFPYATRLG